MDLWISPTKDKQHNMDPINSVRARELYEENVNYNMNRFSHGRSNENAVDTATNTSLQNLPIHTNTCYITCIAHAVLNLDTLTKQLLKSKNTLKLLLNEPEFELLNDLLNVIECQHSPQKIELEMHWENFLYGFFQKNKIQFPPNQQCDAAEFLDWLLNFLDSSYGELRKLINFEEYEQNYDNRQADGLVKVLFAPRLQQTVSCSNGQSRSQIIEELSLDMFVENKSAMKLVDCIAHYFRTVLINTPNDLIYCESCNLRVPTGKKVKIATMRPYLILNLKRFRVSIIFSLI